MLSKLAPCGRVTHSQFLMILPLLFGAVLTGTSVQQSLAQSVQGQVSKNTTADGRQSEEDPKTIQDGTLGDSASATSESKEKGKANYEELRQRLRQLEDDELRLRDEAEAAIIEMGREVLKFLPSVTPQTSGEMKIRLQRIRQALERQAAESYMEASRVSIRGRYSLSSILEKMQQQTHNEFQLQNEDEGAGELMVVAEWDDVPFWTAVEELLKQTNHRIVGFAATENRLALAPGYSENPVRPFTAGPFRVEMVSVACQQNFGSQIEGQATINLLFSWEPRLEPLFMQLPMVAYRGQPNPAKETGATKEIGATNPQASPEVRLNVGGSSAQVEVLMERPDRGSSELESLRGQFIVAIPGERHQYVFEKFGSGARQSQKYGDVSVTLEGSRRNGPVYEIRMFVEFGDAAGALDSFRGWVMSNRAYLSDAAGGRIENVGFQTYSASSNGVGMSYLFQINQDPNLYQLIYESPSAVTRQTVDFELKHIPLP